MKDDVKTTKHKHPNGNGNGNGHHEPVDTPLTKLKKDTELTALMDLEHEGKLDAHVKKQLEALQQDKNELESRRYLDSSLAHFAELMRWRSEHTLESWADELLTELVSYVDGLQASLYILSKDGEELTWIGGYACPEETPKTLKLGEGLTGQAAKSALAYYYDEPDTFQAFSYSGLSNIKAKVLLIQPLLYNEKVEGVLEVSAVEPFNDTHLELIRSLGDSLGASLSSVRSQVQLKELFKEAQEKSEELLAQEEELRQNLEELEATQEEMRRVNREFNNQLNAINHSTAVVEFELDGTIVKANENFLSVVGYEAEEVVGQHHSMFVSKAHAESEEYAAFWANLRSGEHVAGEFLRLDKKGQIVWILGSYNPMVDENGKPYKVIKFCTDISAQKEQQAEIEAAEEELRQNMEELTTTQEEIARVNREFTNQLNAINRSNAVVEFNLSGEIMEANANFLSVVGYELDEVRGKHHRIFVDEAYGASADYQAFWERLNKGEYFSGEFERKAKNGESVWIWGSYNPMLDENGKPYKVIKFCQDITARKKQELEVARLSREVNNQLEAINRSTAVVEFELDGTIISANKNFLDVVGYGADEVEGKHHRMFVTESVAASQEYADFWAKLGSGEFVSGEFMRVHKNGQLIWILGSYNPLLDENGKPYKVVKFCNDITQQKEAQAEIEAAEEELRQNMEELEATQEEIARVSQESNNQLAAINRSNAVVEMTLNGEIINANENFLKVVGYSLDEVKGRHHRIFVDRWYSESEDYKKFWEELKGGDYVSGEFQRVRKDGQLVYIWGSYNPMLDADGKPYKIIKFCTDITEQKEQQMRMEAQEEELRQNMEELAATQEEMARSHTEVTKQQALQNAILNNSNDLIAVIDTNFKLLAFNQAFAGYCLAEGIELAVGQYLEDFVKDESVEQERTHWACALGGQKFTTEEQLGNRHYEIVYKPMAQNSGKIFGAVMYMRDITALKEQAVKVEAQNQQLAELQIEMAGQQECLNNSAIVSETDIRGNITYVNDLFLYYSKYTRDEVMGKNHRFLKSGKQPDAIFEEMWKTISSGNVWQGEILNKAKDGSYYRVFTTITPIKNEKGYVTKYVSIRFLLGLEPADA